MLWDNIIIFSLLTFINIMVTVTKSFFSCPKDNFRPSQRSYSPFPKIIFALHKDHIHPSQRSFSPFTKIIIIHTSQRLFSSFTKTICAIHKYYIHFSEVPSILGVPQAALKDVPDSDLKRKLTAVIRNEPHFRATYPHGCRVSVAKQSVQTFTKY